MIAVPVQTTPTFIAGTPKKLFDGPWWTGQTGRTYDVTADGRRFLMIRDAPSGDQSAPPTTFSVVLNWIEELKQRVPIK